MRSQLMSDSAIDLTDSVSTAEPLWLETKAAEFLRPGCNDTAPPPLGGTVAPIHPPARWEVGAVRARRDPCRRYGWSARKHSGADRPRLARHDRRCERADTRHARAGARRRSVDTASPGARPPAR
jgi:hypothetical protein